MESLTLRDWNIRCWQQLTSYCKVPEKGRQHVIYLQRIYVFHEYICGYLNQMSFGAYVFGVMDFHFFWFEPCGLYMGWNVGGEKDKVFTAPYPNFEVLWKGMEFTFKFSWWVPVKAFWSRLLGSDLLIFHSLSALVVFCELASLPYHRYKT